MRVVFRGLYLELWIEIGLYLIFSGSPRYDRPILHFRQSPLVCQWYPRLSMSYENVASLFYQGEYLCSLFIQASVSAISPAVMMLYITIWGSSEHLRLDSVNLFPARQVLC